MHRRIHSVCVDPELRRAYEAAGVAEGRLLTGSYDIDGAITEWSGAALDALRDWQGGLGYYINERFGHNGEDLERRGNFDSDEYASLGVGSPILDAGEPSNLDPNPHTDP